MDRYSRKDATAAFHRLVHAIGGRVATSYNDVGAYRLDWNPTYGGGNIERIENAQGGVSQPWGASRMNARAFCHMVHFAICTLGQKERM